MFVRSCDRQSFTRQYRKGQQGKGSGKVALSVSSLALTFERSEATIKKNLRLANKLGVFWLLEIKGDEVRLVYTSFTKLCSALNITDLGAIYEIYSDDFEQVRSLNIRYTVARKQRNAQQAAIRTAKLNNAKGKGRKLACRVVKPNRIFDTASTLCDRLDSSGKRTKSNRASGVKVIKKIHGRFLLVGRQFIPYGVSQETVSNIVGRTPQTIRKHLNQIKDLTAVDRFQVCAPTNDAINTPDFWLSHNIGEKKYMQFDGDRTLYVANTNIYDLEEDAKFLIGCRGLRKRVSQTTRSAKFLPCPLGVVQA